jgi:hypothetical protein
MPAAPTEKAIPPPFKAEHFQTQHFLTEASAASFAMNRAPPSLSLLQPKYSLSKNEYFRSTKFSNTIST